LRGELGRGRIVAKRIEGEPGAGLLVGSEGRRSQRPARCRLEQCRRPEAVVPMIVGDDQVDASRAGGVPAQLSRPSGEPSAGGGVGAEHADGRHRTSLGGTGGGEVSGSTRGVPGHDRCSRRDRLRSQPPAAQRTRRSMEITHIRAGTLADPTVDALLTEIVDFDRTINRALGFGRDFDPLPGSVRGKLVRTDEFTSHELWLGRLQGRLVAKAGAYLSLTDNTDVADVYVGVLPQHRRSGLGTELLTVMERQLGQAGRTRLNAWCEMPVADFRGDPRRPRIAAAAG